MKRNFKILLVSTVIATNSLMLFACNNSGSNVKIENEEKTKGGYLEEDIVLPEDISFMENIFYKDNKLNIIARGNDSSLKRYALEEENNFLEQPLPQAIQDISKNMLNKMILDIAYINDDSYVLLIGDYQNNKDTLNIVQGNDMKEIPLDIGNYMELKTYNNEIYIYNTGQKNTINRYDLKGNKIKTYDINANKYMISNNEILTLDTYKKALIIYDLETGNEKNNISKIDLDFGDILAIDSENNIYICGKNGIEKLIKDKNEFEKLVDGDSTFLGMPTIFTDEFVTINDKEYYVALTSSTEGTKIVKYKYDEKFGNNFKTEINVYMLQDNAFIKQAIFDYKKTNKDIGINIQVGYNGKSGITKEDAIKNLNTEILAGKAPDIIILDGLNVDSYIEKGVLLDISDIIMPLLDNGELLENIITPFVKDNKIYTVPTRFAPSTIWADNEVLANYTGLDSLARLQQENKDEMVLYPIKPEKLIEKTFKTNTQILNEDGSLNEQELKKYLENIKILSSDKDTGAIMETELEENIGALEYLAFKDTKAHIQEMTTETEFDHSYASIKMNGNANYKVNNGYFVPLNMIGINAKSKNLDIAKDIVKTALSEQTQKTNILTEGGFTVNKKVFDSFKVIKEYDSNTMSSMVMMIGVHPDKQLDVINYSPKDEEKVEFYKTIEQVNKPIKEDDTLMKFIIEESKGYLNGKEDIEQTTKAIIKKASTYLAE